MAPALHRFAAMAADTLLVVSGSLLLLSCGIAPSSPAPHVDPTPPTSKVNVISDLQQKKGWTGLTLLPTAYTICSACSPAGPEATWSMTQQVSAPSISGHAMQLDIGGQMAFSDILWNNHLVGDLSSQGIRDPDHSIVPSIHNFIYDVSFYATNFSQSQALEFDINQFTDGKSYIWGHECRIAGGNEWDIWDNQNKTWIATGIACNPVNNAWNHLIIQVQRTDQDQLVFQSITLNGQKSVLNHSENPTSSSWHGVTINYQQDGNRAQESYSVWIDNLTFSYW